MVVNYTCNLQSWITIFPGSYFIMRIALCIHIWTWHTLHILRINKYIILWRVKYQMWRCQPRVLTSSVLINLFACYLISLGLTPAYDIFHIRSLCCNLLVIFIKSHFCTCIVIHEDDTIKIISLCDVKKYRYV